MYCQTSDSVQFERGNTRTLCPPLTLQLYKFQNSGRWFLGSHCPSASRSENTLSLARAFSSSLRAQPIAASIPFSVSASNKGLVLSSAQHLLAPSRNGLAPLATASQFVCTIRCRSKSRHVRSR